MIARVGRCRPTMIELVKHFQEWKWSENEIRHLAQGFIEAKTFSLDNKLRMYLTGIDPDKVRYVRMSSDLKKRMVESAEHVAEFGRSVGYVSGPSAVGHPFVDVLWFPDALRYAYHPDDLDTV